MVKAVFKSFKSKRCFGIEMEVSQSVPKAGIAKAISNISDIEIHIAEWEQSHNNPFWHVKQDSSCGDNAHNGKDYGWEIASFKAKGYKDLVHISKVAAELTRCGVKVNNNCGLHIHAEVRDFSVDQMSILMAMWAKIEPIICLMLPPHRVGNKHCRLWTKSNKFSKKVTYTPRDFWACICPNNLGVHENQQKRVSLNLVNFVRANSENNPNLRKTIELRMPEGTLDSTDIVNWVRLFILFVDSCKDYSMPINQMPVDLDAFMKLVGLSGSDEFYILSKGMLRTKMWVLNRIIKYNSEIKLLENRSSKQKLIEKAVLRAGDMLACLTK